MLACTEAIGDNSSFLEEISLRQLIKEPEEAAQACVIWMHGLGADLNQTMGLAAELQVAHAIRHVFLEAPKQAVTINQGMVMPAWYDIRGFALADRQDQEGIARSSEAIVKVIDAQKQSGIPESGIFLAGFSQGGAMAMHTALHYQQRIGGVVSLSGYLPLPDKVQPSLDKNTPFFLGAGQYDMIVKPEWAALSKAWLVKAGFTKLNDQVYPMEHSVCLEELRDLSKWFNKCLGESAR